MAGQLPATNEASYCARGSKLSGRGAIRCDVRDGPPDPAALRADWRRKVTRIDWDRRTDVAIRLAAGWEPAVSVSAKPTAITPMAELDRVHPTVCGRPHRPGAVGGHRRARGGDGRRVHATKVIHLQNVVTRADA